VKLLTLDCNIMKMMPGPAVKDIMKMEALLLPFPKSITSILIT
jgi:hypothetical protein